MQREIWIFGNPDRSAEGFPSPGDLTQYIKDNVYSKENRRYRYTQARNPDIIVLSRDGKAFGHLEIDERVRPIDEDRQRYPRVKWVYLVRKSALYSVPVQLSRLGITKMQYGKRITEDDVQRLQQFAGGIQEYGGTDIGSTSEIDLQRILREVRQRLGQTDFKKRLLESYKHRCAMTDYDAVDSLEAAHIIPYADTQSNATSNGLLLRADIHVLFDSNLIGINPATMSIRLAPRLRQTSYAALKNKSLRLPDNDIDQPDRNALKKRWELFTAKSATTALPVRL